MKKLNTKFASYIRNKENENIFNAIATCNTNVKIRNRMMAAFINEHADDDKKIRACLLASACYGSEFFLDYARNIIQSNPFALEDDFSKFLTDNKQDVFIFNTESLWLNFGDLMQRFWACGTKDVEKYIPGIYSNLNITYSTPITQRLLAQCSKVYCFSRSEALSLFYTISELEDEVKIKGSIYDRGLWLYLCAIFTRSFFRKRINRFELLPYDNSGELMEKSARLGFPYANIALSYGPFCKCAHRTNL